MPLWESYPGDSALSCSGGHSVWPPRSGAHQNICMSTAADLSNLCHARLKRVDFCKVASDLAKGFGYMLGCVDASGYQTCKQKATSGLLTLPNSWTSA